MTTTAPSTTSTDSAGVTVGELAAALGMSRSAILRAVESGRFPPPMDERRHGWRVWHPAVALALEVAHEFEQATMGATPRAILSRNLRGSAFMGEANATVALMSIPRRDSAALSPSVAKRVERVHAVAFS